VEDHLDTARLLWLLVAGSSYAVKTAGEAAIALELAAQESFDVFIADIGLPDKTGYELMKQIRERLQAGA
jgi:DNA-binding response OmpR family regulator